MIIGVPKEIKRDEYRVAMLPVGMEEIVRLNLMSAVFAPSGVGLFFLVVRSVLLQVAVRMRGGSPAPAAAVNAAGAGAALLLAFSETWWAQALSVEVYPLHGFLVTAVAPVARNPSVSWPSDAKWKKVNTVCPGRISASSGRCGSFTLTQGLLSPPPDAHPPTLEDPATPPGAPAAAG